MNDRNMIVFAGINGAGKSTYFTVEKDEESILANSIRINADEILKSNGGDWHSTTDNMQAMAKEIKLIRKCIKDKKSFNFETTLAASIPTYLRYLNNAKQNGFSTHLIYVGLNSAELAVERVEGRVVKGGHGVDRDLILKRYTRSIKNLSKLIREFDEVTLYDNSEIFRIVYSRNQNIIRHSDTNFEWAKEAIKIDSKDRIE